MSYFRQLYCYKKKALGTRYSCEYISNSTLEGTCQYYSKKCNLIKLRNGCFVFNSGGNLTQKGDGDAVELQFKDTSLNDNVIHSYMNKSKGNLLQLLVFIHNFDEPQSHIMELSKSMYPFGFYNIQLQKEVTKRQPPPYISNCSENGAGTENLLKQRYTRRNCYDSCRVRRLYSKCGAVLDHMENFNTSDMSSNVGEKSESELRECLDEHWHLDQHVDLPPKGCDCPYPCNDIIYKQQVQKVIDSKNNWHFFVRYSERSITHITQTPLYTIPNALSNLGGFMGLLAGLSVLSLAEIIFFLSICLTRAILALRK